MDDCEDEESSRWPADVLDAGAVRAWIASALSGGPGVVGPLAVYQAKTWGVTASFATTGAEAREVIFKATLLPLFAAAPAIYTLLDRVAPGCVPRVLATRVAPGGGGWMLFAPFEGMPTADGGLAGLVEVARTLAAIQVAMAETDEPLLDTVPRAGVGDAPNWLDTLLGDIESRYAAFWAGDGEALRRQFALPHDVLGYVVRYRSAIARWVAELEADCWPLSIDHVDLHGENAVLQPNGRALIFDWEEANLSLPYFALDRLLEDARDLAGVAPPPGTLYTAAERGVRDAYLGALPWGSSAARLRAFDVAMCLAPLKTAYEASLFAAALGWDEGAPHIAAWALGRALPRWAQMARQDLADG